MRANSFLSRGIGLLGQASLESGEGLWLPGTAIVHTVGMRFNLDLIFLDSGGRAVRYAQSVAPGQWWVSGLGASSVVELDAGALEAVSAAKIGDLWSLSPEREHSSAQ
jgi:uncharacterized membrane protein (UPF0127 family)